MTLDGYLQSRNLTQDALAQRLGVNQSYVSQLLNRKRRPSPEIAKRIEAATNGEVSAASLLGVADDEGDVRRVREGEWVITPGRGGEVTLPPHVVADLGFAPGEALAFERKGEEAVVTSVRRDWMKAREMAQKLTRQGGGVVEELIAERRAEAARE